jgi:hypothetical protein
MAMHVRQPVLVIVWQALAQLAATHPSSAADWACASRQPPTTQSPRQAGAHWQPAAQVRASWHVPLPQVQSEGQLTQVSPARGAQL